MCPSVLCPVSCGDAREISRRHARAAMGRAPDLDPSAVAVVHDGLRAHKVEREVLGIRPRLDRRETRRRLGLLRLFGAERMARALDDVERRPQHVQPSPFARCAKFDTVLRRKHGRADGHAQCRAGTRGSLGAHSDLAARAVILRNDAFAPPARRSGSCGSVLDTGTRVARAEEREHRAREACKLTRGCRGGPRRDSRPDSCWTRPSVGRRVRGGGRERGDVTRSTKGGAGTGFGEASEVLVPKRARKVLSRAKNPPSPPSRDRGECTSRRGRTLRFMWSCNSRRSRNSSPSSVHVHAWR